MPAAVHHIELWTADLLEVEDAWRWLLTSIGWRAGDPWEGGRTWRHQDGTYIVLEQSVDVSGVPHDRMRPGLNHLALNCGSESELRSLRAGAAARGGRELFADRYPSAGGSGHTALFLENQQGFEVEIVLRCPFDDRQ